MEDIVVFTRHHECETKLHPNFCGRKLDHRFVKSYKWEAVKTEIKVYDFSEKGIGVFILDSIEDIVATVSYDFGVDKSSMLKVNM